MSLSGLSITCGGASNALGGGPLPTDATWTFRLGSTSGTSGVLAQQVPAGSKGLIHVVTTVDAIIAFGRTAALALANVQDTSAGSPQWWIPVSATPVADIAADGGDFVAWLIP